MKRYIIAFCTLIAGIVFSAETNAPPRLDLVEITRETFLLDFTNKTNLTVGAKIGEFTVVALIPKTEKRALPNGEVVTVDVSQLKLKHGNKTITLVKGHRTGFEDLTAHLIDKANKNYMLRLGDELSLDGRKLRVTKIDTEKLICLLEDTDTGATFTMRKPNKFQEDTDASAPDPQK